MPLPSATQFLISMWLDGKFQPFENPLEKKPWTAIPTTRMYETTTLCGSKPALSPLLPSKMGSSPGAAANVIQAAAVPDRTGWMPPMYVPREK